MSGSERGPAEPSGPDSDKRAEPATLVRHEEEVRVDKETRRIGAVRARKHVETEHLEATVPAEVEHVTLGRMPPYPGDTGEIETLPDGTLSIPVLAEEPVVSKRIVVKERIRVGKRTLTEPAHVEAEVRKERVDIDADPGVEVEVVGEAIDEGGRAMETVDRDWTRVQGRGRGSPGLLDRVESDETKPFWWTSEFLVFLLAVGAIAGCVVAVEDLDLWRGLILITALTASYILSRGLAKSGTRSGGGR